MKKSQLISYSIVLITSMLMFGCSTSERVDETQTAINNPDDSNTSNGLEQVTPGTQIIEEVNPSIITPEENNPQANSANNKYIVELTTNKEVISNKSTALISYNIKDIFSGNLAENSIIQQVSLRVDGNYLNFFDQAGGIGTKALLEYAEGTVALTSLKKSGTTYIELIAEILFYDAQGNESKKSLTSYLPMAIVKNGSSTMTIIPNYADDHKKRYDNDLGLYIDTFTIHVVDKYGNKAKDGTKVHVGIVNNLKKSADGSNNPLYSSVLPLAHPSSTNMGSLIKNDQNKTQFSIDAGYNFDNVRTNDTVVITANENQSNPLNLGGWGVQDNNTTQLLDIWHNYSVGQNTITADLSFAIGNDKKVNVCEETLATAAVYATEGYANYLVQDGIVIVELRYDPYMVGKTTFIYANSTLEDKRIGVSRRIDMQGTGPEDFYYVCDNTDEDNKSQPPMQCDIGHILKLKDSKHLIQDAKFTSYIQQDGTTCAGVNIYPDVKIGCDGAKYVTIFAPPGKKCGITMGDFKPEFE